MGAQIGQRDSRNLLERIDGRVPLGAAWVDEYHVGAGPAQAVPHDCLPVWTACYASPCRHPTPPHCVIQSGNTVCVGGERCPRRGTEEQVRFFGRMVAPGAPVGPQCRWFLAQPLASWYWWAGLHLWAALLLRLVSYAHVHPSKLVINLGWRRQREKIDWQEPR